MALNFPSSSFSWEVKKGPQDRDLYLAGVQVPAAPPPLIHLCPPPVLLGMGRNSECLSAGAVLAHRHSLGSTEWFWGELRCTEQKRARGRGAHKRDGSTARPAADQQATGRSQYQTQASHGDPLSLSIRQGGKEPGAWDRCGSCTVEIERWLREAVSKCPSLDLTI